jgi:hypothetical protein
MNVVDEVLLWTGGGEHGTFRSICNQKSPSQLERHSHHTSLSLMFTLISLTFNIKSSSFPKVF